MGKKKVSKSWVKGKEFRKPIDYTLENNPEQEVTLKRLGMEEIMKLGVTNELDFMSKALMSSDDTEAKPKEAVAQAIKTADDVDKMTEMINAVVVTGVIDPKVYPVPMRVTRDEKGAIVKKEINEEARQDGLLYVDEIPYDDRVELFSVIFDTEGLTTFREEQTDGVGDVADVPSVQLPADGSVAVRSDESEGVLPE